MKETNLEEVRQYRFFQEFEKPIECTSPSGESFLLYGYFPYHTVSLVGDCKSYDRNEFNWLDGGWGILGDGEPGLLSSLGHEFYKNKYLLVADKYCIYLHDSHARKGDYKNIVDYDYREVKPIKKGQTYDEWYAINNINPKFYM